MHIAKNATNSDIIFRSIAARIRELLASPMPTDPLEILSRTQALLLYQIMLTSDGDVRSTAVADANTDALEDAAIALLEHVAFADAKCAPDASPSSASERPQQLPQTDPSLLPLYPLDAARDAWTTWVFQESARRTFITLLFFVRKYMLPHQNSRLHACLSPVNSRTLQEK